MSSGRFAILVDGQRRSTLVSLCAALLLSACAAAPGMRISDAAMQASGGDTEKPPEILPITLKLNEELRKNAKPTNVGVEQLFGTPQPYRVGPGDIISVVVWDHPELVFPTQTYSVATAMEIPVTSGGSNMPGYVVSPSGDIQFPYAGVMHVAGKTTNELRTEMSRVISRVVRDPQMTVRVLGFRSQRVYVDGEVKTPGALPIDDAAMTLVEALNRAGGVLNLTGDNSRIRVTRGEQTWYVDMPALLRKGIDPSRILLRNGDIVRVEQREGSKVFVTGEVVKPVSLIMRDGRMSLNEALGDAGGVNPGTANAGQIYVIRKREDGSPLVYHLDGTSPVALAVAEGFEMQPKDVVYVDANGVVRWSRVMSMLIQPITGTAGFMRY
ncbi:MAG: multidrug MFS transporter [Cupriavidus sp.]|uniref:polysaccharide biosynthesis/export family protein n=1 Tax=Cupriavidus pauculus TaxID=82633 RepID=UPI0009FCA048|nr:polysaccharide biosynthesis/export family protein [Cupriavidus pauculus]MBU66138.1 multidrug MFS transporter [Cupriavidus sp.]KAB0600647.1 multidrug MFS transporter [Cupriavidus pauculus]MBY4733119.1 polysaccharide biosynthesis/export family protein [Cupriavidus pauculus]MCM3607591.1 polysaccharide biosynthesis/export family protein [Cupriavidus pauculus]UAL01738.1 polysaccharide biosynthesis/export family protein [Cupriavidus pauculus]